MSRYRIARAGARLAAAGLAISAAVLAFGPATPAAAGTGSEYGYAMS